MKLISDIIIINFSFILAYYLRFKILLFITPTSLPVFDKYLSVLFFITLLWLAIFKVAGLYENKKYTALVDELASVFLGVTLASLALVGLLFLYKEFWFSRLVIGNAWVIAFLLLALSRTLVFFLTRLLHRNNIGTRKTLIIGAGEIGQTLAEKMLKDRGLGFRVVGFLDNDPVRQGKAYHGLPVLGEIAKTAAIIQQQGIVEVIIAGENIPAATILEVITECERFGVQFKLVPGILELIASRVDVDELAGVPLLTVSEIRLQGLNAAFKRSFDLVLSGAIILLISPLLLLFAVLVKLTSPGPVIFLQERIGQDGQPFFVYKFRSMVQNAEALLPQLAERSEVEGHLFKIKNDPRLTPLGAFMRRYSIDELPQLFNVFFGQMSLVGPRPPLPREVAKYNAWQKKRLRVRPGITGPWQVAGRSLLPFDDMVRLDIYYIENWSLWLDLKILLRTIPVVLTGYGAY